MQRGAAIRLGASARILGLTYARPDPEQQQKRSDK